MCVSFCFVRTGSWNGSIRDGNGRTALHFAATGGSAEVVSAIFDMAPSVINSKVRCKMLCVSYVCYPVGRIQYMHPPLPNDGKVRMSCCLQYSLLVTTRPTTFHGNYFPEEGEATPCFKL